MKYSALMFVAVALLLPSSARADSCEQGQIEGAYVDGDHLTTVCHEASGGMVETEPQDAESPGAHDAGWEAADTTQPSSEDGGSPNGS